MAIIACGRRPRNYLLDFMFGPCIINSHHHATPNFFYYSIYLPTYQSTYLLTYLPTYIYLIYFPTYVYLSLSVPLNLYVIAADSGDGIGLVNYVIA